ncbi:GNAT family N-acetyltransferase [Kitasatospora sp. NA04385]|uniref:GNAT family N-acetyltransferase n=1 Tax=Kitasatospora sp. NA04385 TaxID=2742135 RepID=UPI0015904434|nr:GNAT family N-acetyltransferase [Kitasatospora sp. NA04385]QKW20219.1 GNAT family N-acetyltransferase [Kitasatospora sp. NA04385]
MGNDARQGPHRGIEIRPITHEELADWDRAIALGFMRPHVAPATQWRELLFEPGRMLGAFDHDGPAAANGRPRCVATFRSFDTGLTVPGGALLPVDAITAVTVNATHRRRGLLSGMMRHDLTAARERGAAAAILIAAEHNIYGRFGFGSAAPLAGWRVDVLRSGGIRAGLPVHEGHRIDFATLEEFRKHGPELHERWRPTQPGAIGRPEAWWRLRVGEVDLPGFDWKQGFTAFHRTADGTLTGMLNYTVDDKWDGSYPDCPLTVRDFIALDRETANALWAFAFSVDWVRHVVAPHLGAGDVLPLLLADPRGAKPHEESSDFTWLRLLDLPAAFAARRYEAPGRLVLDVTDREGWTAGRWALETAADGTGRITPTDDPADLALDVSRLGTLYLGGGSAAALADAALLTELTPGAAVRADTLLRTARAPWNPDGF